MTTIKEIPQLKKWLKNSQEIVADGRGEQLLW